MKTFRAILIDPEICTVKTIDTDASLASLHELIRADTLDSFRMADHGTSFDQGWVDDGGLLRGKPIHAFLLDIVQSPFAGRCVVIGVDKDFGRTCDARIPAAFLRERIKWLGLIRPEVVWDETENVKRAIVTYARVKSS